MKKSILFFVLLAWLHVSAQSPIPYEQVLTNSSPLNTATTAVNSNKIKTGNPFSITGNGNITLNASTVVQMIPNTSVSGLSSTGLFHAQINSNVLQVASFHANGFTGIPKYDRFEIGIILPPSVQQDVDYFLANNAGGKNPYNPDEIKVKCTYNIGSNSYVRYGFYFEQYGYTSTTSPCSTTVSKWLKGSTDYKFRVRLAPPEVGNYTCKIELFLGSTSSYSSDFTINVSSSSNKGHLRIATGTSKKMEYEDGTKFFAIGENQRGAEADYCNPDFPNFPWPDAMASPITQDQHRTNLHDIAIKGGNFARIRLDLTNTPIIGAIWNSDHTQNLSIPILPLYNYNHNQMFMWEMDKTVKQCEDDKVKIMLNILCDNDYSTLGAYSDQNEWDKNPFSRLFPVDPTTLKATDQGILDFFDMQNPTLASAAAKDFYKKMLFYLHARWGYSTSIAMWEMINETENLGHRVKDHREQNLYYGGSFTNPTTSFAQDVKDWTCDNLNYLTSFYPVHLKTTGTVSEFNNFSNMCLNIYSRNDYHTDYNSAAAVDKYQSRDWFRNDIGRYYFNSGRPFIFGEIGLDDHMNMLETVQDVSYHNSIWASVFSGAAGTPMNWQDQGGPIVNHRANFTALKAFTDMIDFNENLSYHCSLVAGFGNVYDQTILTYWLKPVSNSDVAFGWTRNTTANWTTETQASPGLSTSYMNGVYNYTGYNPSLNYNVVNISAASKLTKVTGLSANSWYDIYVYRPDRVNGLLGNSPLLEQTNSAGELSFGLNMPWQITSTERPDYAFIVSKHIGSRTVNKLYDSSQNRDNIFSESIYPIPASDKVFLNLNVDSWQNPKVYLADALGRIFEREINSDTSVNLTGFANGSYLLKIKDQTHEKTFKVIINR